MNAAVQLAAGRLPGVTVNVDSLVPDTVAAPAELATAVDRTLFAGTLSDHTRQVITQQVADMKNPVQARALAIGLALGGPDFQRR